ncbi:MAG TPA: PAS domain S-box protein, partial [Trichocoleus sp.]
VSTWYGGKQPGAVTIALSVLALNYYFIPPINQVQISNLSDILRLALFTTVALIINLLSTNLQESKQKIEHLNRQVAEENAGRLRVALNAAQMGMWDWNIVSGKIEWSPEHEKLFGLAPGTFDGSYETFDAHLHPDDREGLNQAVTYSLENRVPYRYEYRVVWTDGTIHWVEGRGQAFYNLDGQAVRMSGTIMAIDERKQAEASILQLNQELQQKVTELETLLDVIPIGIGIAKDPQCHQILTNPAFAQTLNIPSTINASLSAPDEERPTTFKIYQHGREMPPEELPLQYAAMHGVEVRDVELDVVWQDGTVVTLLEYAAPLFDEHGRPRGSIGAFLNITERKRAEAAFRQQQELLQTILDHIPIMVTVFNREGRFQWVNREWERFTGWTLADTKSHNMLQEFYPDPQYRDYVLNYIQAADQSWSDFKTCLRDGSVAETSWANVRLSDGSSIGIGRDVTHERELEREQKRLAAILENSPDFVGIADAAGNVLWLNAAAKRLIGCGSDAELSHLTLADCQPPWAGELVQQQGLPAALLHGSWTAETALRHRNGCEIAVSQVLIAHRAANGTVDYISTVMQDIRQRKQAEESLRLSEEQLRTVLENMPVMLDAFDEQGNIITWNQECERVTGYLAEEMIHSPAAFEQLYPDPSYREQMIANWASRGNCYRNWEWNLVNKSGETKIISWSNLSDDYPVPGWASWGVGVDITERKLAEYALEQLNFTLEQQVQERTAALTLANRELEAFSYSVSHDLRAPLRGIDGFSKALLELYAEQLDDKGKHYLERIRSGTQRMGELIDDMLKLSRVTRAEIRRSTVGLSQMVADVARGLSETQPERSVEWAIAPNVAASGDRGLLQIVVENLLSNAWKFTSTKDHTAIAFGVTTQPDQTPVYFVKDNGVGFDMAYASKLFTAFQRLHSEREFPGTGVGLAIVERIIHRHGGAVWAEGTLQHGATIYFTLERYEVPPDADR